MSFERMKEVIESVSARRGPQVGRALELHAKTMLTLVHFEGYFKSIGDAGKANLANGLMDVSCELADALGVTPQESQMVAEASAGDIQNHPIMKEGRHGL